ncbi:MAG: nicotinate-nucleotide adenylyltransferase [Proteobacteria bacterium]|nr:nicotinate-nucleotide adenylyltransferase [Pseudomonadota bacterium]
MQPDRPLSKSTVFVRRIGLFGGTFNPIHRGHLNTVQKVKKAFDLSQVLFIPAALPPHKEPGGVADAQDRMQMIRLAISSDPALMKSFAVSDVELLRPGPSYTIDTVRHFKRIMPDDSMLFLILGLDAILEIDTWKSYKDLFRMVSFIVMARSEGVDQDRPLMWKRLESYLKSRISDDYRFSASQSGFIHSVKQTVFLFDVAPVPISSTQIRDFVRKRRSITSLVPENVEAFIKTKGLYL